MRGELEAGSRENFSEEEWIVNEVDKKEEIRKKLEAEIKLLDRLAPDWEEGFDFTEELVGFRYKKFPK